MAAEPAEAMERMLSANGVTARVVTSDLRELGVAATPTLFLVDGLGKVTRATVGLVSPEISDAILRELTNE